MTLHTVCFDLDRTLVDTEIIKTFLHELAVAYGITKKTEREALYRSLEKEGRMRFTLAAYESVLSKLGSAANRKSGRTAGKKIRKILGEIGEKLAVKGAREMLLWCQQNKIQPVLLTLGVKDWQMQKLHWSHLPAYFSPKNMLFTDRRDMTRGKLALAKKYFRKNPSGEGVAWVNDRPEEIDAFLTNFPKSIAFLRWELKDGRVNKSHCQQLKKKFGTRVHWSSKLSVLLKKMDRVSRV